MNIQVEPRHLELKSKPTMTSKMRINQWTWRHSTSTNLANLDKQSPFLGARLEVVLKGRVIRAGIIEDPRRRNQSPWGLGT